MADIQDALLAVLPFLPDSDACVCVGRVARAWSLAARTAAALDPRRPRQRHPLLPPWYWRKAWEGAADPGGRPRCSHGGMRTHLLLAAAWHAQRPEQLELLQWAHRCSATSGNKGSSEDGGGSGSRERRAAAACVASFWSKASWDVCTLMAERGCVEGLEWAHREGLLLQPGLAAIPAAAAGRITAVEWALRDLVLDVSSLLCIQAAGGGQRRLLEWLVDGGANLDPLATAAAAGGGHFSLVRWLVEERGVPVVAHTAERAAAWGDLAQLEWVLNSGAPLHHSACEAAAEAGHLAALQMLVCARGARLTRRCCSLAARTGNLLVLRWLHRQQRCPWRASELAEEAARAGHDDAANWLKEQ
jgi:hypothetical protein